MKIARFTTLALVAALINDIAWDYVIEQFPNWPIARLSTSYFYFLIPAALILGISYFAGLWHMSIAWRIYALGMCLLIPFIALLSIIYFNCYFTTECM